MTFQYNGKTFDCSDSSAEEVPGSDSGTNGKRLTARQELNATKLWHLFLRPRRSLIGIFFALVMFGIHFGSLKLSLFAFLIWCAFEPLQCMLWENILPLSMLKAKRLFIAEYIMEFFLVEGNSVFLTIKIVEGMISRGALGGIGL